MGARRRRGRSADSLGARIGAALHGRVQGAAPAAELRRALLRAARAAHRRTGEAGGDEVAGDGPQVAALWATYWLRMPAISWR